MVIMPESSNEFPYEWISIWVGQAACKLLCRYTHSSWVCWIYRTDCDVWLLSRTCGCSCLKCTWSVSSLTNCPAPLAKLNVKTRPLRSLDLGIYYLFGFSRLLFFAFSECFLVILGFCIAVEYRVRYCFSTIFWVLASGLPSAKFPRGSNL